MNCLLCNFNLPKDAFRCPSCRNLIPTAKGEKETAEVVRLSDAKANEIDRYSVGIFDKVFGGGLAVTSTNLVGGLPGAGKTTMFLQIADILLSALQGDILYIANEQSADEIHSTAKRLRIRHMDRILVVNALGGLCRPVDEHYRTYKPRAVILDSLTKLVGEDLDLAVSVADRLKLLTVEYRAPTLIVNQVNKAGEHAGLEALQHAVDGTYLLEYDRVDGWRYFMSMKNRNGPAPVGIELEMTPDTAEIPGMLVEKKKEDYNVSKNSANH